MVAEALLALVRRIVFLVDHDQTQVLEGSEDRRAGADRYPAAPLANAPPVVEAFARGETAVQHGDLFPEPRAEAVHNLVRERDLRHEHDHAALLLQGHGGGPHVDLCLAATRDAIEHEAASARAFNRVGDRLQRLGLRAR